MKQSILDTVHESAKGLHDAGVIKTETMREFDVLCLPPLKEFTAEDIVRIRKQNHLSQAVFAAYLNASKSSVQKWERCNKKPSGPSLKLLNIIDQKGIEALL